MSGQKPDTRIFLKDKSTGKTVTIASFWTDGERPSGGLDRNITRLKVEWVDREGVTHVETVSGSGKECTHYCNLFVEKSGGGAQKSGGDWADKYGNTGNAGNTAKGSDPIDDPDGCPF